MLRVLELFAGIGGAATALGAAARVVLAVDQDAAARATYARRFGSAPVPRNLHHVKPAFFDGLDADLWWMSPPCQPYTIRGHQRDLEDRRSQAFVRICAALDVHRPRFMGLENVPWFQGSESEALLLETLGAAGYAVRTTVLCPTSLGVPAERRRYYLVASREGLAPPRPPTGRVHALASYLDPSPAADLEVPEALQRRYDGALHIVDAQDAGAVTKCFTGAYGRSPVHAGSYLRQGPTLRRFSPAEIGRTLGLGEVPFPEALPRQARYKLVGNSLSVPAVRHVLEALPPLATGLP